MNDKFNQLNELYQRLVIFKKEEPMLFDDKREKQMALLAKKISELTKRLAMVAEHLQYLEFHFGIEKK